jgi:hypothetical protein
MNDRNDTIIMEKFKNVDSSYCHGVLRQKSYEQNRKKETHPCLNWHPKVPKKQSIS